MVNDNLLHQAQKNVFSYRREATNRKIEDEYQRLLYESEKVNVDNKSLQKLQWYMKEVKNIKILGIGHAYKIHNIKNSISESINKKKYHPNDYIKYDDILG